MLGSLDVPDADRARVHSPAGLDIGARSAGEIAVSILAELVSERARPRVRLPSGPEAPTDPGWPDPLPRPPGRRARSTRSAG